MNLLKLTLLAAWCVFMCYGCRSVRIPVSGGKEIVFDQAWIEAAAERVEFLYIDPNVTVWIVVNDPCSSVNPGRIIFVEPKTGISVGLEAE
jgi:hypothetical protein